MEARGAGEMGEAGPKRQTCRYKIHKSWGCGTTVKNALLYLKVAKRIYIPVYTHGSSQVEDHTQDSAAT